MHCAGNVRRGFTLIEILMVVVIIGIASALVIPQMGSRDDLKVAAACRLLMADMAYAQNRAIATQRMHYIRFSRSTSSDSYTIYDGALNSANIVDHPVNHRPYVQTFGPTSPMGIDGVRLGAINIDGTGSTETLSFDSLGSPFSLSAGSVPLGATGTIQFSAAGSVTTMTVRVEPYTGELSVVSP